MDIDIDGFPRWHSSKELACQFRGHNRHGFDPCIGLSSGGGSEYSSTLAQGILRTEESGRLQSLGSHRVRHY